MKEKFAISVPTMAFQKMGTFFVILCAQLGLVIAFPSWGQSVLTKLCKQHQAALSRAQQARTSVKQIMRSASEKDLVFIGESHDEDPRNILYREMLGYLLENDRHFNCLFVEDGSKTVGATELEKCNEDRNLLDGSAFDKNFVPACKAGSTSWLSIENEAYKRGLKVYAIDPFADCMSLRAIPAELNNCRDGGMQLAIQRKIDEGKCDKAIAVNGFPHLTSIFPGHLPLAHRRFYSRKRKLLSAFRINFTFSDFNQSRNVSDSRWSWSDWRLNTEGQRPQECICANDLLPVSIPETYGFFNRNLGIKRHPMVWMENRPYGNWMDFDATIVAGVEPDLSADESQPFRGSSLGTSRATGDRLKSFEIPNCIQKIK